MAANLFIVLGGQAPIEKYPSKKIKVIKLGFDKSLYYPKNCVREKFFLVIGRHNPYKYLTRLLKAFKLF